MSEPARSPLIDYAFALAVAMAALLISYFLLGRMTPFLPCVAAVALASWKGGRGPGLLAMFTGVAGTALFLFIANQQSQSGAALAAPLRDVVRILLFIVVSLIIISTTCALRRAESRAIEQSKWLGDTLNNMANGVIAADDKGLVEYLNPVARTLTGWGDEAIGLPLTDVFKTERGIKQPQSDNEVITDMLLSKDGTRYLIQDCSGVSKFVSTKLRKTVLIFKNITEQQRIETELRETLERLRLALDAGDFSYWDWDLKTNKVVSEDLTKIFKNIKGPAPVESYFELIHPDDVLVLRSLLEKAIANREPFTCKFRCVVPENQIAWVESYGKLIFDDNGEPLHVIGVSRNITEERLVEDIVREGHEQFRSLAESARDGFVSIDEKGKILYANASCAAIFGYSRSELIGRYFVTLAPPWQRVQYLELFEKYKKSGVKTMNWSRVDFIGMKKDESQVPLEIAFSESRTAHKVLFTAVLRDVSERKKAEVLVQAARERLILAQRIAGIGTYEWDIPTGRTTFSPELEALYGMEPTTFGGLHEYRMALIHPEDLARVERELQIVLGSGAEEFNSIFRVQLADKSVRWIVSNGKVFRNNKGEPEMLLGAERDITAQKHSEAEREKLLVSEQNARERLTLAQRAAGMGTYERNLLTGTVIWTPEVEALFGLEKGAFDGRFESWIDKMHPDDREKTLKEVGKATRENSDYYVEYRVIWPDGSVHWLGSRGKAIFDPHGVHEMSLGACLDVTQRRALEVERDHIFEREKAAREHAERSSRLKDEFIATVSHELRTPLTAILGWSKMLLDGGLDVDQVNRGLQSIDRNARTQARLVEDLLDLSRITAGRMRIHLKPMNLADAVTSSVDGIRPTAQAKKIKLELRLVPAIVNGDTERLQQVVYNIIFNAVKFSEREGLIEISIEALADTAKLTVRDHGIGVAPEFQPQMFRLFSQEDSGSTRRFGGMGLGLVIVRNLVELHGGTVHADSEGEGKGTTLTVQLPLHRSGDTVLFQRMIHRK